MAEFRYSVCDPLKPEILEMGTVSPEVFTRVMNDFDWIGMLNSLHEAEVKGEEIFFSPSLELHNTITGHGIAVSIIGEEENYEFHIFYKRPKLKITKGFFRSKEEMVNDYLSDRTGQEIEDVEAAFTALLQNDTEELEACWG